VSRKEIVWSWPLHEFNRYRIWTFYQRCGARAPAERMDPAQHLDAGAFQTLQRARQVRHGEREVIDDVLRRGG
jgi:hypothetical protein